jgi:RHH-type proline utilization regulon transcriptional repressor/proline dehydrogenase/delta 1-pyrroline-5-carboxylate dehydrogenase
VSKIRAGNIYINRNIVGAVVAVQPFGGHGLSGTGPKAGGPLYLRRLLSTAPDGLPAQGALPGPVGERNEYALRPRGRILCLHQTQAAAAAQRAVLGATGNIAVFSPEDGYEAVLLEGEAEDILAQSALLAARPGPIIPLLALSPADIAAGVPYDPAWLLTERVISENTAAAGGNASLMTLGS